MSLGPSRLVDRGQRTHLAAMGVRPRPVRDGYGRLPAHGRLCLASPSIVLFGGQAMMRPYLGSTMVTAVNSAVSGLIRTLAIELAPVRVNAVHPGIVGDSPRWVDQDTSAAVSRSPIGRLVTMGEVADAVLFLLDNGGVNGVNLAVDGGWLLR